MPKIEIIDLHFQNLDHTIASYLIETSIGPVLIETGPHSTFAQLNTGLNKLGYKVSDIKHVFLTHIHLDHAGAAWEFARQGANIYLHPFGAKNMADPSRLMDSARRIYKDRMDELWGRMEAIPEKQLMQIGHNQVIQVGDTAIKSIHSPGHAKHHIAWQIEEVIFTGDVAGVSINKGPVVPPCPPPDINIDQWKDSIAILRAENPSGLYLTHYGKVTNIEAHLDDLEHILDNWSNWIRDKMNEGVSQDDMIPLFIAHTTKQLKNVGLDDNAIQLYEAANPSWMSVAGLMRYWTKKEKDI